MSEMDKLVLYQKMYDLILYSFPIINRFPYQTITFPKPFTPKTRQTSFLKTITVKCVICGDSFEANDYGHRTRNTCSPECKHEQNRRYQADVRARKAKPTIAVCKKCKKPFEIGDTYNYCPKCSSTFRWSTAYKKQRQAQA